MKRGIFNRIVQFSWVFLFMSCLSTSKERCSNSICFDAVLEHEEEVFLVRLFFSSKVDTSLYLDDQMFVVGCPSYQEDRTFFGNRKPLLNELKYSQIILENENGSYRVFSSQLFDKDNPSIVIMPNCAFMDEKKIDLKSEEKKILEFNVEKRKDILVEKTDSKVRIHLYYKEPNGTGSILSSVSWLSVN